MRTKQLDEFLALYKYDTLNNAGTISAEQAKEKAYADYNKVFACYYSCGRQYVHYTWKEQGAKTNDNRVIG